MEGESDLYRCGHSEELHEFSPPLSLGDKAQ